MTKAQAKARAKVNAQKKAALRDQIETAKTVESVTAWVREYVRIGKRLFPDVPDQDWTDSHHDRIQQEFKVEFGLGFTPEHGDIMRTQATQPKHD